MGRHLRPSEDSPGLHVTGGTRYSAPTAEYVCTCGANDTAKGETDVKTLVANYTAHQSDHGTMRSR